MLESIGQVAVNVKDTARARAFYRDVLGLRHLFDAGPDLAFFQCGGVRLMLSPPSERQFDHPGSIIYYKVSDLAATHATIAARGAAFEQPPTSWPRCPTTSCGWRSCAIPRAISSP